MVVEKPLAGMAVQPSIANGHQQVPGGAIEAAARLLHLQPCQRLASRRGTKRFAQAGIVGGACQHHATHAQGHQRPGTLRWLALHGDTPRMVRFWGALCTRCSPPHCGKALGTGCVSKWLERGFRGCAGYGASAFTGTRSLPDIPQSLALAAANECVCGSTCK